MNGSLKNRLIFIITLVSGLTLLISVSFFAWQNISSMKNHMIEDAKTIVNLTGNYCVSCLSFTDKEAGEYILNSLELNKDIMQAVLYDDQGILFAKFNRISGYPLPDTLSSRQKIFFEGSSLHAFYPIYYNKLKYGTLYIGFSTKQLNRQIKNYLYSVVVILGVLFLLVLFLAHLFQKIITQPIQNLTRTTQIITENQDYSVRVKSRYKGEIGSLYDHFNEMLDQIHKRQKQVADALSALSESEERYRKVVELSPSAIILHRDGIIIYANPKAIQLAGYEQADQMIEKNIFEFVHPDFMEKVKERIELMKSGVNNLPMIEEKFIRADGSVLPAQVTALPFTYENKLTILTIVHDISKIREAEKALRHSEIQFRSIFERSNDAMYIIVGKRFILVNPKFIELFGYSKEEIMSSNFNLMDLVSEESKEFILKRRELSTQNKFEPTKYDFKGITKKGRFVDVEVNLSKIEWDGQDAILGIVRDVTEQRFLAEQLRQSQKMEAIGVLAGGVAHDFNNLLTVISGHVELSLLKEKKNSVLYRHLTEIEKAGKRAQDLTRQLLAFSRKQVIELKIVNINNIIKDMYKMLVRIIGEDIRLDTVLTQKIVSVKADPGQLDQIIMNLIVNATDAINAREGTGFNRQITIETDNVYLEDEGIEFPGTENTSGLHVMLSVSDTGIGMDEEIQSKIFEPFFTTKGVGKGTGLGMSTIYGIVKQNEGQIHVYSEKGLGTTVKIYWPSEQSKPDFNEKEEEQNNVVGGKESVLFVEDEQSVREFAVSALKELGYKIYPAKDATHALHLVNHDKIKYDILVTDLVMPEISGNELAERLQETNPDLKIIFTSGYTDGKLVNKGVLVEGIQFIQKPYSVKTLSQRIRQVLDKEAL